MLSETIRTILARDLRALAREVDAYPSDDILWRTPPGISNSAGTLVLHVVGNLQHFIGAVLGNTGFIRDRDAEFATRGLTRGELRSRIETAASAVDETLRQVTPQQLEADYPAPVGGRMVGTEQFLVHLVAHLGYHLGQVDYHRRILLADDTTANVVAVSELAARE